MIRNLPYSILMIMLMLLTLTILSFCIRKIKGDMNMDKNRKHLP